MRILFHAINYLPNTEADARRISGLVERLTEIGCRVDVVVPFSDTVNGKKRKLWFLEFRKKEMINGVRVYRYYTIPYLNRGTLLRLLNNLSFALSSIFHIFSFRKYDVVITSSPPLLISLSGYFIARFKGAKLIFDVRDIWPDIALEMKELRKNSFIAKIFNFIAKWMYKKSDLITTVSLLKKENIENKNERLKGKVEYISNGVDDFFLKLQESKSFKEEYKFDSFFSVIHVGKIGKAQDLDSLLDLAKICRKNKDIRFFLIGDGVERNRILKRIEEENIENVVYCGKRNINEVYTAYKYAKLSYVSLVNENLLDSVPTKLYESLFMGCPVLLSAKGESRKVLEESRFGLGSDPKDLDKLTENFFKIYNNYNLENKEYCINYINENYNRKNIARKLLNILKKLDERK
ncbi:MAG TPA: glycosyltransferase family 4 protein [Acholeplasmataceae bacterium]|nr:glycosyltransferase family 4 protein [Acholeplasmataceae bacterium]